MNEINGGNEITKNKEHSSYKKNNLSVEESKFNVNANSKSEDVNKPSL